MTISIALNVRKNWWKMIKYYGGKKKISKIIKMNLPSIECKTFVDLFVGGGSVTDCLCDDFPVVIINDKDDNLINFYRCVKEQSLSEIIAYFEKKREETTFDKVKTYRNKLNEDTLSDLDRAFLYYSCVYCGYGGKPYVSPTKDKYNQYKRRNITKDLTLCKNTLLKCDILCEDFHRVKYENAFYYCDPPYALVGDNTYYGSKGINHKGFNHYDFFKFITEIAKKNLVMISYEDSSFIRELYKEWYIIEIPKKTVNFNPKNKNNETLITNELLILNYNPNVRIEQNYVTTKVG